MKTPAASSGCSPDTSQPAALPLGQVAAFGQGAVGQRHQLNEFRVSSYQVTYYRFFGYDHIHRGYLDFPTVANDVIESRVTSHGETCDGWWPSDALNELKNRGVVDEASFPYNSAFSGTNPGCVVVPDRPSRTTKIQSNGAVVSMTDRKAWLLDFRTAIRGFPRLR